MQKRKTTMSRVARCPVLAAVARRGKIAPLRRLRERDVLRKTQESRTPWWQTMFAAMAWNG
jgi:hypothetical protein